MLFCAAVHQGGALFAKAVHGEGWADAIAQQPLGHREYPLAHRQAGEDMIAEVCRRLHHARRVARGANASALAGIGHKVVVLAVITPGPGKAAYTHVVWEAASK